MNLTLFKVKIAKLCTEGEILPSWKSMEKLPLTIMRPGFHTVSIISL